VERRSFRNCAMIGEAGMIPFQNLYELDGNDGEVAASTFQPKSSKMLQATRVWRRKTNLWSFITSQMPARIPMGSACISGWSTTQAKYIVPL